MEPQEEQLIQDLRAEFVALKKVLDESSGEERSIAWEAMNAWLAVNEDVRKQFLNMKSLVVADCLELRGQQGVITNISSMFGM